MSAPVLLANTDLVAVAWLATVPGLSSAMVATTLPSDVSKWAATGFVTVRASGGADHTEYPLRQPVVTVDCWATRAGSAKPPWNQAWSLAEQIVASTYDRVTPMRAVTLPAGYPGARVDSARVITPPRRAYGDAGNYARVVLDLELQWVAP